MSYDKPIQRIATGGGLLIVLSAIAVAHTSAAKRHEIIRDGDPPRR